MKAHTVVVVVVVYRTTTLNSSFAFNYSNTKWILINYSKRGGHGLVSRVECQLYSTSVYYVRTIWCTNEPPTVKGKLKNLLLFLYKSLKPLEIPQRLTCQWYGAFLSSTVFVSLTPRRQSSTNFSQFYLTPVGGVLFVPLGLHWHLLVKHI